MEHSVQRGNSKWFAEIKWEDQEHRFIEVICSDCQIFDLFPLKYTINASWASLPGTTSPNFTRKQLRRCLFLVWGGSDLQNCSGESSRFMLAMPLLSFTKKFVSHFLQLGCKSPAFPPTYLPNITLSCTNRTKRTIKIESADDSLTARSVSESPAHAGDQLAPPTRRRSLDKSLPDLRLVDSRYCFCWQSERLMCFPSRGRPRVASRRHPPAPACCAERFRPGGGPRELP